MMNTPETQPFSFTGHPEGRAMLVAVAFGLGVVGIKYAAYLLVGSMTVLADVIESMVHIVVIGFSAVALYIRYLPPDRNHQYGHSKIQFLATGMEGGLMCFASLLILGKTIHSVITGYEIGQVASGLALILLSGVINGLVGWYLVSVGRRQRSLILIADGKHILSDFTTTAASVVGLVGAWLTGWLAVDILTAIGASLLIGREGINLLRQSFFGLMDEADAETDQQIRGILNTLSRELDFRYDNLRHRSDGDHNWIELNLIFDPQISLQDAHNKADHLEERMNRDLPDPVIITTHLEPDPERNPNEPHHQAL